MSAGLEQNDNMFSVRETPWHGLGAVLDEAPKGIDDALVKSGLDWEVVPTPVYIPAGDEFTMVADGDGTPTAYANVRSDDGSVLGIVSNRYRILQNREAFAFMDNLIGTDMLFETAGSLNGGKRTWVLSRLPDYVDIGGDTTGIFVFVTNDHTGGRAVKAAVSPVRVVCQNTLTWALGDAKKTERIYAFPHIGDPNAHIIEARNVLGMTIDYAQQFKQFGDHMASQKISEKKLREVLEELYPAGVGVEVTDRVRQNRVDASNHIVWLFKEGPTVGNAPGSKWAAANAICEFIDYGMPVDETKVAEGKIQPPAPKLARAMDDPGLAKQRATELVAAA